LKAAVFSPDETTNRRHFHYIRQNKRCTGCSVALIGLESRQLEAGVGASLLWRKAQAVLCRMSTADVAISMKMMNFKNLAHR